VKPRPERVVHMVDGVWYRLAHGKPPEGGMNPLLDLVEAHEAMNAELAAVFASEKGRTVPQERLVAALLCVQAHNCKAIGAIRTLLMAGASGGT